MAPPQAAFSVKEICRRRVLDEMVRRVHGSEGYIAMIVDDRTLRVLSSSCRVYDILEEGVTVVEKIEKRRQPLPQLDALYFLSPELPVIELLVKDFEKEKRPQYKNVHLFFSSAIGRDSGVMEKIASDPRLFPRVKTFVEFNLNFIAHEQRVVHFDSPYLLRELFPLKRPELLHDIADKIVSVCATLGETPYVRYMKPNASIQGLPPVTVCEQLANLVQAKIERNLPKRTAKQASSSGGQPTTLLVLDRSVDTAALLLHEYTYQAMAYDVLDIQLSGTGAQTSAPRPSTQSGGYEKLKSMRSMQPADEETQAKQDDTFAYEFTDNLGQTGKKTAVLSDADELWVRFRHQHISVVNDTVTEEVRKFAKEHDVARIHRGDRHMNTEATAAAIRQLPQYQEMLSKYWVHCTMSEQCFAELERRSLMKIGSIEQDLATGIDKDGNNVSPPKLLSTMGTLLSDPAIGVEEKLRLLMLYFTQMDGIKEDDRKKMMDAARLGEEEQTCILNLLKCGLHLPRFASSIPPKAPNKHHHRTDKERLKYFKTRARTVNFELSRFEPGLKDIVQRAAQDQLDRSQYPYIHDPTQAGTSVKVAATASRGVGGVAGRPGGASQWDWGWTQEGEDPRQGDISGRSSRSRLLVFLLGGATHSEIRSVYEISDELQIDVVLVTTGLLSFKYLYQLMSEHRFE
ncbi:unnamed protein product [Vitrella brassicaformis CCMP3155]|uniref:Syntaxin binding protein 1 n=2 Tax=Vitrella brassicaformis TaxID=1169539 RepID=A0A0G4EWK6_VITBC|nr:unnamed protein product [Vitrella brassicaformis CCMP3155]|mmetsp:Transcript_35774/g.89077  ORF Transcript_35774/g.89077 Transcript_35774/m.89077 type:complete len:685 (+) Transcript_35774:107-2161(+)|eukprot:CEM02736.1 unnamed protein product [Vitrella brassicaformis CCMP3155]